MKKLKVLISLFFTMFKIGLFTFGGGYAMISVMQREFVEKKKYIDQEEFLDIIAIAESTPGPIAINSSTYIGYKKGGFLGALFSTLGMIVPSFAIIFIISLFFDEFLQLEYVSYAFHGIQACVAFLILSAGIKMFKGLKKGFINIAVFIMTFALLLTFDLLAVKFSTIFYILIGGTLGVIVYLIEKIKNKEGGKK